MKAGSVFLIFPFSLGPKVVLHSTPHPPCTSPQHTNIPHLGIQSGAGFLPWIMAGLWQITLGPGLQVTNI